MTLNKIVKNIKLNFFPILLALSIVYTLIVDSRALFLPMIAEPDAYSRSNISKEMVNNGDLFKISPGQIWLPAHFFILNATSYFFVDLDFGQRAITFLLSLASIFSIYYLTKNIFNNKNISYLSAITLTLLPIRRVLSTQTLSETTFVFFFLTSLAFLTKKTMSKLSLICAVLFFLISSSIRYEAWFALPFIFILIFRKFPSKIIGVLVSLLFLLFPLYWLYFNAVSSGNIANFFTTKVAVAQNYQSEHFFDLMLSTTKWATGLFTVFPLIYLLIFAIGYYLFIRSDKKEATTYVFYFLPIYFFVALVAQAYFGTMEWFPLRYLLIPIVFAIPIFARSILSLYRNILKIKNPLFICSYLIFGTIAIGITYNKLWQDNAYRLTKMSFFDTSNGIETPEIQNKVSSTQDISNTLIKMGTGREIGSYLLLYYVDEISNDNFEEWLFYLTKMHGRIYTKNLFDQTFSEGDIVVWEKNAEQQTSPGGDFSSVYENEHYVIYEYIIGLTN